MLRVRVSSPQSNERTLEFPGPDVLIGAGPPSDLVVDVDGDGPVCAILFESADGWRVRDVACPGGLRVVPRDGEPVTPTTSVPWAVGDVLELGGCRLERVRPLEGLDAAARPRPPPMPLADDVALAALMPGAPADGMGSRPAAAFQPHLEVFEPGATEPRQIVLGRQPILFGGDTGSHVRMTGFRMPDFVAAVETLGDRVTIRPVTVGVLGPKVMKDGKQLKEEVALQDGERVFIGEVTVFFRLQRRR